MAEILALSVWKDLLPVIFARSCDNYEELWREISEEKTHVYQCSFPGEGIAGYIAIEDRPLSLHIECAENVPGTRGIFRSSGFDTLEWMAFVFGRWAISCNITDPRIGRVLKRFGFFHASTEHFSNGFCRYKYVKVLSWAKARAKRIQRQPPKTPAPLPLQQMLGYRERTLVIL